jgi:hypothetical protein
MPLAVDEDVVNRLHRRQFLDRPKNPDAILLMPVFLA